MIAVTSSEAPPTTGPNHRRTREPQHRYGAVLTLIAFVVVFLIAAPSADWSLAVAVAVQGVVVLITVATSRQRESVRRRRAIGLGLALLADVLLVATGVIPRGVTALIAVALTTAVPVALIRGLLRLIRERGVTRKAVAGSLAIYLSIGLIFAWVIGFAAYVEHAPYFSQHASSTQGEKVYFSFTALTTTGFGDFTPASPAGHAIAVIEMLIGQLYLVTVIGLLIGSVAGRRAQSVANPP